MIQPVPTSVAVGPDGAFYIVREEKITRLEGDNGRLETIVLETGERIARHGMLIRPKQTLRSDLAEKLGCELNEFNLIKTINVFNETSVKGVYAAGDITSPMQAIAVAVFQGSAAASGLNHALIAEDFANQPAYPQHSNDLR